MSASSGELLGLDIIHIFYLHLQFQLDLNFHAHIKKLVVFSFRTFYDYFPGTSKYPVS